MDLTEFIKKQNEGDGRRKRCKTCSLPEELLGQINAGRKNTPKVTYPDMSLWLDQIHGVKIQPYTIRNHFVAGHHND